MWVNTCGMKSRTADQEVYKDNMSEVRLLLPETDKLHVYTVADSSIISLKIDINTKRKNK